MKNLILVCLLVSASAHAQSKTVELSKKDVILSVDISTTKLKRSSSGYSTALLKVLVPELADVTILDHRNAGEPAPCLATYDAYSPEDVIQGRPDVEKIKFTITLQKIATLSHDPTQTCSVTLNELVEGTIRGFKFIHERSLVVGNRNVDDCR